MPMRMASAASVVRMTLSAMLHFCRGEKLGWGDGVVAMLFPAATFDDAQRQKQKEKRDAHVEYNHARVQNAAREIEHLLRDVEEREHFGLPVAVLRKQHRQVMQQQ